MDTEAAALAYKRWAKAKRTTKTCPFCGQAYRGVKEQVYCTPAHQQGAANRRHREKRRAGALPGKPDPLPVVPIDERRAVLVANALDQAERARARGADAGAAIFERVAAEAARAEA